MTRFARTLRVAAAALLALAFTGMTSPSRAETGSIRIEVYKAGFIVGAQGGSGSMTVNGKRYRLGVGGVSYGLTIGASKAVLVGRVLNLRRPSDVAGTYGQAQAGVAVVSGAKVAQLINQNGVVLELRGHQVGLEFSLDLSGLILTMR